MRSERAAVRLGFRQIGGFSEDQGKRIEAVRGEGFNSIRDLWLRTGLKPFVLERLAEADAFRSLGLDRREAFWAIRALRRAGDKDDLPLFARTSMDELEPDAGCRRCRPASRWSRITGICICRSKRIRSRSCAANSTGAASSATNSFRIFRPAGASPSAG